jgi:hypothetical protein
MRRILIGSLIFGLIIAAYLTYAGQAQAATAFSVRTRADHQLVFKAKDIGRVVTSRVFVDSDLNPATGFQVAGIGAEYLLENDRLSFYLTDNPWTDWLLWRYYGSVPFTVKRDLAKWIIYPSYLSLHCTFGFDVVFWIERHDRQILMSDVIHQPPIECPGVILSPTPTLTHSPEFMKLLGVEATATAIPLQPVTMTPDASNIDE